MNINFEDGIITKEILVNHIADRIDKGLSMPRSLAIKEAISGDELEIPFDWVFNAVDCPVRLLARMWYLKQTGDLDELTFTELILSLKKGKQK